MKVLPLLDLTQRLDRATYEQRLVRGQNRLYQLRLTLGGLMGRTALGPGVLVVLEGPDASGKGGAIKAMVGHLDPRHYDVVNYGAPSRQEKDHHFLWRFYSRLPGLGQMSVFDRSWYGRVLVERVEGYATRQQWKRAYDEIVQFERMLVAEGVIVVKFWLQVSPEEQLRRFESRRDDPLRRWKLTDEDWRNRDKIDLYNAAVEDMFKRTDHDLAPWHLVSGEQKRWARVQVLETLVRRIEAGLTTYEAVIPDDDSWN